MPSASARTGPCPTPQSSAAFSKKNNRRSHCSALRRWAAIWVPVVSSALHSGLTADCTSLEIGPHTDNKSGKVYENLLYQIRPAFGGNIIATIINPDCRPQMATVREGVMKKEVAKTPGKGVVKKVDHKKYTSDADFVVRIIEREMEERKINIKGAPVIIAGGYGMGCKENFALLHELAEVLGGEVGASRAAVDAGHGRPCPPDRTDRRDGTSETLHRLRHLGTDPAHRRHDGSSMIISINTDPEAPINKIADYAIMGDVRKWYPR